MKGSPTKQQLHEMNPDYVPPSHADLVKAEGLKTRLAEDTPPEILDLITNLLCYEPSKRLTAE
jgi:hypothetical protein